MARFADRRRALVTLSCSFLPIFQWEYGGMFGHVWAQASKSVCWGSIHPVGTLDCTCRVRGLAKLKDFLPCMEALALSRLRFCIIPGEQQPVTRRCAIGYRGTFGEIRADTAENRNLSFIKQATALSVKRVI